MVVRDNSIENTSKELNDSEFFTENRVKRTFSCRAYMHLNKDRKEKGRHAPKAAETITLGFTTDFNTSGYKLLIESTGKTLVSNQVRFDENLYPYWNCSMAEQNLSDIAELIVRLSSILSLGKTENMIGSSTHLKST
jgi:hypothetical protein